MASNVNTATAVGGIAGAIAAPIINAAAIWVESKTGIDASATSMFLGGVAAFFMRWAAKLHPDK